LQSEIQWELADFDNVSTALFARLQQQEHNVKHIKKVLKRGKSSAPPKIQRKCRMHQWTSDFGDLPFWRELEGL